MSDLNYQSPCYVCQSKDAETSRLSARVKVLEEALEIYEQAVNAAQGYSMNAENMAGLAKERLEEAAHDVAALSTRAGEGGA